MSNAEKLVQRNWGNKSKKEEFEGLKSFSEFQAECWKTHKKVGMKMKGGKLVNDCRPKNEEVTNEAKKCWKGYEKKGTQKLFGKTYNRCVKKRKMNSKKEQHGQKNQERTSQVDSMKRDESLMKERIQDLTLRHLQKGWKSQTGILLCKNERYEKEVNIFKDC